MEATAYILAPHVALRSWERVPHAYVERFRARPRPLSASEFRVALACDGAAALEPSAELDRLVRRGLVRPCAPGAAELSPWQRFRACPNRVMPWLALEITSRCNYNCIHCFNATDNARLHAQMTLEQVKQVLDGAQAAGVNAVLLTGGEPLMHPRFFDIMAAVYSRGMFVFEINTNGRFLTAEVLERIASFGFKPEMKISFDGLGFHDWMRGCKGAEQDALRAIKQCVDAGFPTRVQMNINRKNRESILPSLELLDRMGVGRARVIPTTPSTRWELNAQGQSMDWGEYLQAFLDIAAAYAQGEHTMELDGWHAATLYPTKHAFRLIPVRYAKPDKGTGHLSAFSPNAAEPNLEKGRVSGHISDKVSDKGTGHLSGFSDATAHGEAHAQTCPKSDETGHLPTASPDTWQRGASGLPAAFKESRPCCSTINGMAAVAADGGLYPCLQCSGWCSSHGVSFGNVFADGFANAITGEAYSRIAHATVADKLAHLRAPKAAAVGDGLDSPCASESVAAGDKLDPLRASEPVVSGGLGRLCKSVVPADERAGHSCAECPWLAQCAGGCPALAALANNGDMLAADPTACEFFHNNWPERFARALAPWKCLNQS